MAFFEQRIDERLTFGAQGGPVFSTSRAMTIGGFEKVNKNWSAPLHRYNIQHCIRTAADFEELLAFFYVVSGSFDGFRFKDWGDYKDDGRCVLQSTTSGLQIFKMYTVGARTFYRKISKPVAGGSIPGRPGATINTTTGIVTGGGATAGDAWVGEFDVPVRFESDEFLYTIANRQGGGDFLIDPGPINLREIRL